MTLGSGANPPLECCWNKIESSSDWLELGSRGGGVDGTPFGGILKEFRKLAKRSGRLLEETLAADESDVDNGADGGGEDEEEDDDEVIEEEILIEEADGGEE